MTDSEHVENTSLHPDAVAVAQASAAAAGLSLADWLSRTILDNAGAGLPARDLHAGENGSAADAEDPLRRLSEQIRIAEQAASAERMNLDDWLSRAILTAIADESPAASATPAATEADGQPPLEPPRDSAAAPAQDHEQELAPDPDIQNALEAVAAALDVPRTPPEVETDSGTQTPVPDDEPPIGAEDRLAQIVAAARRQLDSRDGPPLDEIIAAPEERAAIVLSDVVSPGPARRRLMTWLTAMLLALLGLVAVGIWLIPSLPDFGIPLSQSEEPAPNTPLPPVAETVPGDSRTGADEAAAEPADSGAAESLPMPEASDSARPSEAVAPPQPPSAYIEWYENAGRDGDSDAQLTLARLYLFGDGVPRNYQKAAEWFLMAAEGGDANAQYAVGVLMERGLGVAKDPVGAIAWYEEAAESGHVEALNNTGIAYFEGKAVARDYTRALRDFQAAAEAGLPEAQYNLALLYAQGRGVERNTVQAYKWYGLALGGGEDRSKSALDRLTAEMSEEEIARARKLIAGFRVD
jgi:hypothetical protein